MGEEAGRRLGVRKWVRRCWEVGEEKVGMGKDVGSG